MTENEAKTKDCRAPGVAYDIDGMGNWLWPSCSASSCAHWVKYYKRGESHMDVAGPSVENGGHCGLTHR